MANRQQGFPPAAVSKPREGASKPGEGLIAKISAISRDQLARVCDRELNSSTCIANGSALMTSR